MSTTAWHLRNDGNFFPIIVHIYPMQDETLASEAEVASFIISTNSKDQEYAKFVLDAFMALQIENSVNYDANQEDIENAIYDALCHLPFKFAYPLSKQEMIKIHRSQNNFYDIDTLYDFIDEIRNDLSNIWTNIKDSFNQQFCRVRYGGQFNSVKGNNGIWFRIASVHYNWDNIIYQFTANMLNKFDIEYITICRDPESDDSNDEYIYRAKDGTAYYNMPIDEFFSEEHERNPVFSATQLGAGVIHSTKQELKKGNTLLEAYTGIFNSGIRACKDYRPYLLKQEIEMKCIEASEWFDELATRTKMKLNKVKTAIKQEFPEITDIDIDFNPRENSKGNPVGFELLFTLVSNHPQINNEILSVVSTKSLSSTQVPSIVRLFRLEYNGFIEYRRIRL